eukprot:scaffold6614_cov134-Pinguiococcus_pyrenoidosus.AAC.1
MLESTGKGLSPGAPSTSPHGELRDAAGQARKPRPSAPADLLARSPKRKGKDLPAREREKCSSIAFRTADYGPVILHAVSETPTDASLSISGDGEELGSMICSSSDLNVPMEMSQGFGNRVHELLDLVTKKPSPSDDAQSSDKSRRRADPPAQDVSFPGVVAMPDGKDANAVGAPAAASSSSAARR